MKITTQAQLDAAPKGVWHDLGPGYFEVRGGMKVDARSGSTVHALSGSTVFARSGSTVHALNGSTVKEWNGSEWVERGAKVETASFANTVCRDDIPYLLAEVKRLTTERDDALLDVVRMRDTQKDMGSVDDAVRAIVRRYPDDPYAGYLTERLKDVLENAEVKRLRGVVEAVEGLADALGVSRICPDTSIKRDLLAILNTGLEGDGEATSVFTAMGLDEPEFPTIKGVE